MRWDDIMRLTGSIWDTFEVNDNDFKVRVSALLQTFLDTASCKVVGKE